MEKTLRHLAKIVRSKNSGPFELTFDVVFDDPAIYRTVKTAGLLTKARIAELYRLRPDQVLVTEFFDPALSFKATIVRTVSSGSAAETDTYGGQQSAPLLELVIDVP